MIKIRKSDKLFMAIDFCFDCLLPEYSGALMYKTVMEIKRDSVACTDGARFHFYKINFHHGLTDGYYNVKKINQNMYAITLSDFDKYYDYPKYQFLFNETYETDNYLSVNNEMLWSDIVFKLAAQTDCEKKCYNVEFLKPLVGDDWKIYAPVYEMERLTATSNDGLKTAFIMPIKL